MRKEDKSHPKDLNKTLDDLYTKGPSQIYIESTIKTLKSTLREAGMSTIKYTKIENTPIGIVFVAKNERGVIAIDFGIPEDEFIIRIETQHGQTPISARDNFSEITKQLSKYLANKLTSLSLSFDIHTLTKFQQQVLQATSTIPRGQVYTYSDIAQRIGNPKAVRAVGQALGRNPVPLLIPCHRVIASNGKLGGYSGGGGVETKRKLLVMEGAIMG